MKLTEVGRAGRPPGPSSCACSSSCSPGPAAPAGGRRGARADGSGPRRGDGGPAATRPSPLTRSREPDAAKTRSAISRGSPRPHSDRSTARPVFVLAGAAYQGAGPCRTASPTATRRPSGWHGPRRGTARVAVGPGSTAPGSRAPARCGAVRSRRPASLYPGAEDDSPHSMPRAPHQRGIGGRGPAVVRPRG